MFTGCRLSTRHDTIDHFRVFLKRADLSMVGMYNLYTPFARGFGTLERKPHINGRRKKTRVTINCRDRVKIQLTGRD